MINVKLVKSGKTATNHDKARFQYHSDQHETIVDDKPLDLLERLKNNNHYRQTSRVVVILENGTEVKIRVGGIDLLLDQQPERSIREDQKSSSTIDQEQKTEPEETPNNQEGGFKPAKYGRKDM